ncbi:MAG: hypothetical protein JXP34_16865 [Planctomycetes bacterium]|nr:hypothetical protein [Planctomycetota bacterium]
MRDAPRRSLAWGASILTLLSGCVCYRESNSRSATTGGEEWTMCGDVAEPAALPPSVREVLARGRDEPPPPDPAPGAEEVLDDLDPLGEAWEEMETVARRPDQ